MLMCSLRGAETTPQGVLGGVEVVWKWKRDLRPGRPTEGQRRGDVDALLQWDLGGRIE
jgi:hypothetical protein